MRIRRSVIALAMLTLVLMPRDGKSQGTQQQNSKQAVKLGSPYPNPTNPEARLKIPVGDYPACPEGGKQYKVTVKIFNILAQLVAVPQLEGSSGGVAGGQRMENLLLPCGEYTAYWNGKYLNTSREVASGVYIWSVDRNGEKTSVRSTIAK